MFLKARSLGDVFLHLLIILILSVAAVLIFFYVYLPATTHHAETIIVPNLAGKTLPEIENILESKHLRFQVNDSMYTPGKKPLTVLAQHPIEGSQVKENRKIYLSVSSLNPPKVKMPQLIDGSLKNAEILLKSHGLEVGKISTVPSPYLNLIVDQMTQGASIKSGTYVPKGSQIDLKVGDGTRGVETAIPNIIGKTLEDAKRILEEKGLDIGLVENDNNSSMASGVITKQTPLSGTIKSGEMIDVWIAK